MMVPWSSLWRMTREGDGGACLCRKPSSRRPLWVWQLLTQQSDYCCKQSVVVCSCTINPWVLGTSLPCNRNERMQLQRVSGLSEYGQRALPHFPIACRVCLKSQGGVDVVPAVCSAAGGRSRRCDAGRGKQHQQQPVL